MLFPEIEPYRTGFLKVDHDHELYFEESGNPNGKPALFLHGGPGGGTTPKQRRFFDPKKYHIILIDQRGSGKSRAKEDLDHNTTWDLVQDLETLRNELKIEKWLVLGGSWGSTLGIAYAETHPEVVTELILRGVYLGSRNEDAWLFQPNGVSQFFPDQWHRFANAVPETERKNLLETYWKRALHPDPKVHIPAQSEFSLFEESLSTLLPQTLEERTANDLRNAKIELHYFYNGCFMKEENQLLKNAPKLNGIPGIIVQGRYDVNCLFDKAWKLHQAWTTSELRPVPNAGHSGDEPGTIEEIIRATNYFAQKT